MGKSIVALAIVGAFTLTGCNAVNRCGHLPPPTPEQNAVATPPVEVDQPGLNGAECELIGGEWREDRD